VLESAFGAPYPGLDAAAALICDLGVILDFKNLRFCKPSNKLVWI